MIELNKVRIGEVVKTEFNTFYRRVFGTVGGYPAFVEVVKGKDKKRRTALHDSCKYELIKL